MVMKKIRLKHHLTNNGKWFSNEVREAKKTYDANLQGGMLDKGFVWASIYLEIFLEGVFTRKGVPNQIEVNVPKGLFRLTALWKEDGVSWLIRNDTFGCIASVNPEEIGQWAADNYPEGIGTEGYRVIAHTLLTTGTEAEDEKRTIWDATFYEEPQDTK